MVKFKREKHDSSESSLRYWKGTKEMQDYSDYLHSPAHLAVARRDYASLRRITSSLPRLAKAVEVKNESESLAAEQVADAISAVIDRRDVPGRETPLHLAVRLGDPVSTQMLMAVGADWTMHNEDGWTALQEAVWTREPSTAMIIARHRQALAWARWSRRLPRFVASASRIRDFYVEITFHFESSVIPFISRIAPSDTYRIWKRGSNLRADMTLAGFDGFPIKRSPRTFLFLGEGYFSEDSNASLPPGSLIVLHHEKKEVTNALEGAGTQPTRAEVARQVAFLSRTSMSRPGIDVSEAELVPHLNWMWQETTEMVGSWKAKVYDMLNVIVNVKSRKAPTAMTYGELLAVDDGKKALNAAENDFKNEPKQLDPGLQTRNSDGLREEKEPAVLEDPEDGFGETGESIGPVKEKESRFSKNSKGSKMPRKVSKKAAESKKPSDLAREDMGETMKGKGKSSKKKKKKSIDAESKTESDYKKGLRPVLWLTPDFPLQTEELLPLLDILAYKVKAVRRLRDLLTTKLPNGTFPVKVAIPCVPTVRVVITFTKFEELQPVEEFLTPFPSPSHFQDANAHVSDAESSTSWISWMTGSRREELSDGESHSYSDETEPFHIPPDYTWVDTKEKKRRKAERLKSEKQEIKSARRVGSGG